MCFYFNCEPCGFILQLPSVGMEAVLAFLQPYGVEIESNARNLYEERYLNCVRHAEKNDTSFILARCRAQMKKSLSYRVSTEDQICISVYFSIIHMNIIHMNVDVTSYFL